LALFLYFALKEFSYLSLLPRWRDVTSLDFLGRVGLLAALFGLLWVAHQLLQPFFSTRPIAPQHSLLVVRSIGAYSVAKPLVFLLTQVLYYGPAVILMVLFWRPMVRQAHRQGTALVLGLALGLLLALCSEPRYWMVFFPIFVVLLAKVLDEQALGFGRLAAIAGLGFFLSKAWLPLNWAPWPPDEPFHYEDVFRFPMQAFFMNYGTWMTTLTYAVQAAVVGVATLVLSLICTKTLPLGYGHSRYSSSRSGEKVL
jgi:hypothetical protein